MKLNRAGLAVNIIGAFAMSFFLTAFGVPQSIVIGAIILWGFASPRIFEREETKQ